MLRKGRDKKYGDNDDNSMVVFLEFGIGMKTAGGTFNVTMCNLTSQLEQWSAQAKLETQIAATYGSSPSTQCLDKASRTSFKQ